MGPLALDLRVWWRGYAWCAALAIVYAALFALIPWAATGASITLGQLTIVEDGSALPRLLRWGALAGLILSGCIAWVIARHRERIDDAVFATLSDLLARLRVPKPDFLARVCVGAGVFMVLVTFLGPFDAVAGAGAGAGAVLALGIPFLGLTVIEPAVVFGLFLLMLPLANAFFDWLSWLASRWLGRHWLDVRTRNGWWRGFRFCLHMVLDLGAAALVLVGLAFVLPRAVEALLGYIAWAAGPHEVHLADYLIAAACDPLGDGLWISLMLFSTLFPTALHLAALIASPVIFLTEPSDSPIWQETTRYLLDARPENIPESDLPAREPNRSKALELAKDSLHRKTIDRIVRWRLWRHFVYTVGVAVSALLLFVVWHSIATYSGPLPTFLYGIATWQTLDPGMCIGPTPPRPV